MQYAVQGFGNVGAWAAEMIHVRGGRVLCVSDRDGAMTNEKGLDIPALRRHLRAAPPFGGSLLSFPGGKSCLSSCPSIMCNTLCSNHLSSSKLAGSQRKQCHSAEVLSCSEQSYSAHTLLLTFSPDPSLSIVGLQTCSHMQGKSTNSAVVHQLSGVSLGIAHTLGLCTCLFTALSATTYTVLHLLVGTRISHDQMFSMPCDVFIPAASSNTINETVAKQLNCKFVVEAANSPTTPAGDAVLREKGIIVCPDIYASGGGVAVSWLEWVQNLQNFRYGSVAGFLKNITAYAFQVLQNLQFSQVCAFGQV